MGNPHVVEAKMRDSDFELQSRHYIHFWTCTMGKGMNSLIPRPSYGLNSTNYFYNDGFGIKQPTKVDMPWRTIKPNELKSDLCFV